MPVMNNARLNKFSKYFESDIGDEIEQRCFFLFSGSDVEQGNAFFMDVAFQQPDDPNQRKFVKVDIKVDNLIVEQCSDVIVSLTGLVPDFKTVLRYDDLHPKPDRLDLQKKFRY